MPEVCECGWRMLPCGTDNCLGIYLQCEHCGKEQKNYKNYVQEWVRPEVKKVVEDSCLDVEQDIVVNLPPKRQYTIRAKVKSVTKGEPSVVREDV
jgi:uncharacterized protein YaaR (DUF327 family)